jgi:hypothetical protein
LGKDHYTRAVASALDGWFGPAWVEPKLLDLAGHIDEVVGEISRAQGAAVRLILNNPTEYDDLTMDHLWHAKSMSEQKLRLTGELWDALRVLDLWEDFIGAYRRLSRGVSGDEGVSAMIREPTMLSREIEDDFTDRIAKFAIGSSCQAKHGVWRGQALRKRVRIDVTVGHENYLTLFLGVYSVETGRYEIVYEEEERARFMEVVVKHLLSLCA